MLQTGDGPPHRRFFFWAGAIARSDPLFLAADQVAEARKILDAGEWIDGRVTAGHLGAHVKIIFRFMSAALPLHVLPPSFNRYESGQDFGTLIDNAVRMLPSGQRIRTDISCTLFLTLLEDYDGGELVVEDTYGAKSVKLPAEHMILYPATSLHHVTPVTRGRRVSSFFWLQSMIRDNGQRALLFDMDVAIQRLGAHRPVRDFPHRHLSQPAAPVGAA